MSRPIDVDPDAAGVSIYRWTCPICGESRTSIASQGEDPLEKSTFSLRQHVRSTVDDGHGPANELPPGFDPDVIDDAVSSGGVSTVS